MGYFGFATKENRMAWALIAILVLIGAAFWIPGVLQYKKCVTGYNRCVCRGPSGNSSSQCLDPTNEADRRQMQPCWERYVRCRRTPAIIWAVGWLFLVGLSWMPCFYFCCCAQDPKTQGSNVTYQPDGVQLAPVAQPYGNQHFTTQPYASQPYGMMNYPYNTTNAAGPPAPAYPVGQPIPGYPVGSQQQQQQQQGQQQRPTSDSQVPVHRY